MIIIRLLGGLGNQMFQYAAGRSLAMENNCELRLDLTEFKKNGLRQYALSNYRINAIISSQFENRIIKKISSKNTIQKFLTVIGKPIAYFKPESWAYDNKISKLKGHIYLEGSFQSEKYFNNHRKILLNEFSLQSENAFLKDIINKMKKENSVAIHIRHGDYQENKLTRDFHGVLSKDYYLKAIEIIKKKIKDPYFYFFSDDIRWVKQNFTNLKSVFVSNLHNFTDNEELFLISCCRHQIIANSSFSWWGAWLNSNPEKCIIAPINWFNNKELDTKDLIPNDWLKI
jgi:hypothetical protein